MRESAYQSKLIIKLREMFPGCEIIKTPSNNIQGIPDLTIFYLDMWAMLEVKASETSPTQPNQPYYVEKMNDMSFAAFIYPENEAEVLYDLQQAFSSSRSACISKC